MTMKAMMTMMVMMTTTMMMKMMTMNVKVKMAAMTMTRPYVKVVIKLEYKIIMGKFTQDEAKTTQRLPKTVESMFRSRYDHERFPLRIINFSWVACDNSL